LEIVFGPKPSPGCESTVRGASWRTELCIWRWDMRFVTQMQAASHDQTVLPAHCWPADLQTRWQMSNLQQPVAMRIWRKCEAMDQRAEGFREKLQQQRGAHKKAQRGLGIQSSIPWSRLSAEATIILLSMISESGSKGLPAQCGDWPTAWGQGWRK
jgi:hypothetical protein